MKLIKKLNLHFEEYITAAFLVVMTLLIFFQVMSRFLLNTPLAWSEEAARYVFIWTIYLSAALAVKHRKHIRVEVGLMLFKGKAKSAMFILSDILFLIFSIILVNDGIRLVQTLSAHQQVSPALALPMNIVYIIIPLGYGLMALRLIKNIATDIRSLTNPEIREEIMLEIEEVAGE